MFSLTNHTIFRLRNIFFILLAITLVNVSVSQTPTLDSLQNALQQATEDDVRAHIIKNISWEYLNNRSNDTLTEKYIDSLRVFSQKKNLVKYSFLAKYQYAVLERQRGNYIKALNYLNDYITFSQEQKDEKEIANGLYQKAIILDDQGANEESLKIYHDILNIYRKVGDVFGEATTLNAIGEGLKKTGKVRESIEMYNEALAVFERLNNRTEMANCNYNIGDAHLLLKQYDTSLVYFNKALSLDKILNSTWGMAYDYESLGKVSNLKGNYLDALMYHKKALDLREGLNQKRELSFSYHELGKNYLELKNYTEAEVWLRNSLAITEAIGDKEKSKENYVLLSRLFSETGNFKEAYQFSKRLLRVKDSLYNTVKSRQIQELQAKFDLEQKQNAISNLQKESEISQLKLKEQTVFRNIMIAVAVATIIVSFLLFHRYKTIQRIKISNREKKLQLLEEQRKTDIEKQRVAELEKIDKLKDEFLANTSHELRTPLNGIIGLSESLKDNLAGKLPDKDIENLEMIMYSGKRLSNLVNDILDFSKLKNKDLNLDVKPVDLYPLVNLVLKVSAPLAKGKPIHFINTIPRDVLLVNADENRLQQIFYNLIGNAIKFTEKGEIKMSVSQENDMLAISVSDTGIGISKDKFQQIFKSFEQVDASIERQYGGAGLGLSITKQLVELHGGTIKVHSEINQGSNFVFTIPLSDKKRTELHFDYNSSPNIQELKDDSIAVIQKESIDKTSEITILIVDDESINRRVLENHLSIAGYHVEEANSGKEALERLEKGEMFNLILLDVMMPNMSGYEVCEEIRKNYLPSELPIVLLTAKNRVSDLVIGFNVGANDYLTKPFSKNELLSRIKTHLNLHGIHKAASKFVPTEFLKSVGREAVTDVVLGDHKEKEVTVLFSDIRDYTSLSESMSPEQNFKFVNAYVGRMGPKIQKNKGFVNQYLGDGIMALFPKTANNALQACIEMQKEISKYNIQREKDGYTVLSVGMGLHTGALVMGIIGDTHRNDTAIISDTVNTASRMEGVTKYFGAKIIISGESLDSIQNKDDFNFRYLGKVRVKGKKDVVDIYECFDGDEATCIKLKKATLRDYEKGLNCFFNKEFPRASAAFDKVLTKNPEDKVAKYFVTKSAEFTLSGPPTDWDKVNTIDTK
ncbi:tetratricopeptide repeat protein [Tamlana fucoidanivorans]|uniref:histidine kinase n=1 Tax=Allotamlana fucoidanivorans TaxID=2583814 RepID=A0A5C4SDY4_9FLAO|nr:tetratricopeptide repeat protein [Tamlana fucoidanivorans]TNJ41475.1 tetratricopeptide repeat protein [Tamlana fucoidanivorans]